ncbi:MAG: aminodeoxychorismate/anthranilate synthase component II [Gemmatimonadota bacterium]|nr:aminodeoxychorismate/anthranilate synthase component II [Gemmatimonadota bacterium]MDH4350751.1 aminodeoxychorismate/anthranilate synthase component II [Gemmatimonadota bacterium]MDH5197017.1 aminodeoxychorismate/anthranilate synthase component II [Gemmatimonadota bacterium]
MFFVLDNYDSFTYNLVQYLGDLGADPEVRRNDELDVESVMALRPEAIVISPGPGRPAGAGISIPLIRRCAGEVPVLGVCLGHQAIGEAFGARIVRADRLMHGKTSPVAHEGANIFRGLPSPFDAMRYHSLVVEPASVPTILEITAWSDDRPKHVEIMGLAHRSAPVWGVQFHPESIGTDVGHDIMRNFVALVRAR